MSMKKHYVARFEAIQLHMEALQEYGFGRVLVYDDVVNQVFFDFVEMWQEEVYEDRPDFSEVQEAFREVFGEQ